MPVRREEAQDQMEPIPETRETLEALEAQGDSMLPTTLQRMGERAMAIVPECVGLSLALLDHELTLTLAATNDVVTGLDAVQYLDGGPCILSAQENSIVDVTPDELLDEDRWRMYAQASAAAGVRSSLTLPVHDPDGAMIGTVNLYASTPTAFEGHHHELAQALHATASQAVANADLSFSTRLAALQAPQRLTDQYDIDIALGIIAESQSLDITAARDRVRKAAARAGIDEQQAARVIRALFTPEGQEGK